MNYDHDFSFSSRYSSDFTDQRYSDYNIRRMCNEGAARFGLGTYDALKFDCYNLHEVEVVRAHMREKHPSIPFFTTHLFN